MFSQDISYFSHYKTAQVCVYFLLPLKNQMLNLKFEVSLEK